MIVKLILFGDSGHEHYIDLQGHIQHDQHAYAAVRKWKTTIHSFGLRLR